MQPIFLRRAIQVLFYVLVAAVPLVFWQASLFPFQVPKLVIFYAAVELMAGLWLALLLLGAVPPPRFGPLTAAWAVLLAVLIISALAGVDVFRSFWSSGERMFGIVALLHGAVLMLVGGSVLDGSAWRRIWQVSFITSAVAAVLVVIESGFQNEFLYQFFLRQNTGRPGGTFGNAAFLGVYLLFHVFTGAWLWQEARRRSSRIWTGLALVLLVAGIFLSQTIGVILALGFGAGCLFLWYAMTGGARRRNRALAACAMLVLVVAGIFLTRNASVWHKVPGLSRLTSLSFGQADVNDRIVAWQAALTGWRERPLLGWGFENYNVVFDRNFDPRLLHSRTIGTLFDKPHNAYLEYLATGGALGLLAYLFLLGALGYSLVKARGTEGFHADWRPAFGAGLLAYAFHNFFAFDVLASYLPLFLIMGFVLAQRRAPAEGPAGRPLPWRTWAAYAAVAAALAAVVLLPFAIWEQARAYYLAVDTFLRGDTAASAGHWRSALGARAPYRDYVAKDFAATVSQGTAQNSPLPDLPARRTEAISALEAGASRHAQDYSFPLALAELRNGLFVWNGDPAELTAAQAAEERALTMAPRRQDIYFVMARTKVLQKDLRGAEDALRKAIALDPNSGDSHFFYGLVAYQLKDTATGDREIALAKSLGRKANSVQEAITLGVAAGDLEGDYAKAVQYFSDAIDLAQRDHQPGMVPDITLKLAIADYQAGMLPQAKGNFQALVDMGVDLKKLAIWPALRPVLDRLGVKY